MAGQYDDLIAAAAAKYGVDAALIAAIIQHESGGDPNAMGDGGLATGLMQMHMSAALDVGVAWKDLKGNPALQIDAGTRYLKRLIDQFQGNVPWALAAYNQGPTVIGKAKAYADAVLALKGG
jgi:soluble lytic murein transglycosylase-like protein